MGHFWFSRNSDRALNIFFMLERRFWECALKVSHGRHREPDKWDEKTFLGDRVVRSREPEQKVIFVTKITITFSNDRE